MFTPVVPVNTFLKPLGVGSTLNLLLHLPTRKADIVSIYLQNLRSSSEVPNSVVLKLTDFRVGKCSRVY